MNHCHQHSVIYTFILILGAGAPDPWLLNTQTKRKKLRCKDGAAALQTTIENTVCLAPVDRQQV